MYLRMFGVGTMAEDNKRPNQTVKQPDGGNQDIETVAAHVRSMLMRLIAKKCAMIEMGKHQSVSSERGSSLT